MDSAAAPAIAQHAMYTRSIALHRFQCTRAIALAKSSGVARQEITKAPEFCGQDVVFGRPIEPGTSVRGDGVPVTCGRVRQRRHRPQDAGSTERPHRIVDRPRAGAEVEAEGPGTRTDSASRRSGSVLLQHRDNQIGDRQDRLTGARCDKRRTKLIAGAAAEHREEMSHRLAFAQARKRHGLRHGGSYPARSVARSVAT